MRFVDPSTDVLPDWHRPGHRPYPEVRRLSRAKELDRLVPLGQTAETMELRNLAWAIPEGSDDA